MKKQLIIKMSNDLNIKRYNEEKDWEFHSRLIYSAMCDWMRFCLLDKTNENYIETKTKKYLRIRCEEVLNGFLKMFPECEEYFYGSKNESNDKNPVNILRTKLIENGELIENSEGLLLPNGIITSINKDYCRELGIARSKMKYAGITRLIKHQVDFESCNKEVFKINYGNFFESLINTVKWESYNDVVPIEVMNPVLKKAPYQCWDGHNSLVENEVYLSRMRINDFLFDYFWILKRDNKILISKINEHYQYFEEYRRFILWQRKQKNNSITAKYKICEEYIKVKLNAKIPCKEQKFFDTYGWPVRTIQNNMEYIIPIEVWPEIKEMIMQLNFELKEI